MALIWYSVNDALKEHRMTMELNTLANFTAMVSDVSNVVYELEEERGMSAIFLASDGKVMGAINHIHRDELDKAIKKFRDKWILIGQAINNDESIKKPMFDSIKALGRINTVRTRVDSLDIPLDDMLLYYTQMINHFFDMVVFMGLESPNSDITNFIFTYTSLMHALAGRGRYGTCTRRHSDS